MKRMPFLIGLFILLAFSTTLSAQEQASVSLYNRDTYEVLPVKVIESRTTVEGPLAKTHIQYVIDNKNKERIEASINLHLPMDTILTGFGYYYQNRFIKGKMYDNDEAWKIYQAVTSRGRDPGIMDRPTAQDYHAQIFPVEPMQDLKVEIDLVQVLDSDQTGILFELPITADNQGRPPMDIHARVEWKNARSQNITNSLKQYSSVVQQGDTALVTMNLKADPSQNWMVRMKRPSKGMVTAIYSGMTGQRRGYYAMWISPPKGMSSCRVQLINRIGTGLAMPTLFGDIPANGRICVTGRYKLPGRTDVVLSDSNGRSYRFTAELSGEKVSDNLAGPVWADKRISVLQANYSRNWKPEIVRLSKQFNVISDYTALLAIPQEELDYYRKVLAKQQVDTNTGWTRGGDPWIRVKAPETAKQVVAVFPNGDVKELVFDEKTALWSGRFDIPFGTAEGEYKVIIIVVQEDGTRSKFVLVYENRLNSAISASATSIQAHPGEIIALKVAGSGISRAVAVTPWGERSELIEGLGGGVYGTSVTVPKKWPTGESKIAVVLLDGAHNRTEITIDLKVN